MVNNLAHNQESHFKITFFTNVLIFLVFILMFNPSYAMFRTLFADDASYLSHGFTIGLDFNFKYKDSNASWVVKDNVPSHPIGPGVLAAPFITVFSIIDRLTDNPVIADHHQYLTSWSYFGFVFATFFYFICGLWLYYFGLKNLNIPLNAKHYLFIASSYGILVYVLIRPILANAFEFFTLALCFWSCTKWIDSLKEEKVPYVMTMCCAISIILTILVRPSNINVFLLPIIIFGFTQLTNKQFSHVKYLNKIGLISIGLLMGWLFGFGLITILINQKLYGMYFPSAEALYGLISPSQEALKPSVITKGAFDFQQFVPLPSINNYQDFFNAVKTLIIRSPKIVVILFSSEFGLVYNSTILVVGTISALALIACQLKTVFWKSFTLISLIAVYTALPIAIILFWQYAGSIYGYRFIFCIFPIAIMGFAAIYNKLIERYNQFALFPVMIKMYVSTFWLLCAFGLIASSFWYLNKNLIDHSGINSFGIFLPHSNSIYYNFIVIFEMLRLDAWYEMILTRTIGFYYVGLLEILHIPYEHSDFFKIMSNSNFKIFGCLYHDLPGRVYVQVTILGALFVGSGIYLSKQD